MSALKKRYCFFLYSIDPGGLEVYLLRFLRHYQGEFEATLICKSGQTGQLLSGFVEAGIQVLPIKGGYWNIQAWYRIYRLMKMNRFDGVCDLTSNFGGMYMWLAKMAGIKNRMAYYGQSTNHFKSNFFKKNYDKWVNQLVYKNATAIVLNSVLAMENFFSYRNAEDQRFAVVYNGVDASMFVAEKDLDLKVTLGLPKDSFVIGHTGRYDEKKNHEAVIRLAKLAIIEWPSCYIICCGNGTEQLLDAIQLNGLTGRMLALGYRDDVHRILQTFDVFYFPSYTEGQPNSLIEAMMAGLPFVASDITPIRDTIPAHLTTQLVDPDDVASALALIKPIFEGGNRNVLTCRDWAIEKYNANDRFREFLDPLKMYQ